MNLHRLLFHGNPRIFRRGSVGLALVLATVFLLPQATARAEKEEPPKKRKGPTLQQRLTMIKYNNIEFKGTLAKEALEYLVMQVQVTIDFHLDKAASQHRVNLALANVTTLDCMKALCREAGWEMTLTATNVEIRKKLPPKS